jgi:PDZ domain-containing protein
MSRRTAAGLLALGLAAVLVVIAALQPVPYVTFRPGPTLNVLDKYLGKNIIDISGHPVYRDKGGLRMVTVIPSQPDDHLSVLTVMAGWFSPDTAVLPKDAVYKKKVTNKIAQAQSAQQMTSSQDAATIAALAALHVKYARVVVGSVDAQGHAKGLLEPGDELVKIDGAPVYDAASLIASARKVPVGRHVTLVVRRHGALKTVVVTTGSRVIDDPKLTYAQEHCPTGEPVPPVTEKKTVSSIGISIQDKLDLPFKVSINLGDNIGGPSAGMMFALTIVDLLTPGSLTGGKVIAGSGEISPQGVVGAIGGIGQKLVGATRDGARLFLVASENWSEAIHSHYDPARMRGMSELPPQLQDYQGPLYDVVRELEAHASASGWDQPEKLFALAETADLVQREPDLAAALGLDASVPAGDLTPIEQEPPTAGASLEDVLAAILWPEEVAGVAAIAERLVLPPEADSQIPQDPAAAKEFAAQHPDRQEVRIVAAVLRTGETACALRLRSHDADDLVLTGPDLVPALLVQLQATLEHEETAADE